MLYSDAEIRNASKITLTLSTLRLFSSKAQECKILEITLKPCRLGIHLKALAEYSQISTHLQGLSYFFGFFASFCISQIRHQQHKGKDAFAQNLSVWKILWNIFETPPFLSSFPITLEPCTSSSGRKEHRRWTNPSREI